MRNGQAAISKIAHLLGEGLRVRAFRHFKFLNFYGQYHYLHLKKKPNIYHVVDRVPNIWALLQAQVTVLS